MSGKVKLTAEQILAFSNVYIRPRLDNPVEHPACHMDFWRYCCDAARQVAIAAPRSHAKSTAVTLIYLLTCILFRVSEFAIIVSNTEDIAKLFLADIKKELTENPDIVHDFDVDGLLADAKTELIIRFKDGHTAKIMVRGAGQRVRGAKWNHKRPDLIIGDDLEDDEQVKNPDVRKAFRKWIRSALIPALAPRGRIRIVGTILHADSALERLMPESQLRQAVRAQGLSKELSESHLIVEPTRTYSTYTGSAWKSIRFRAHDGTDPLKAQHILWPQQYDRQGLWKFRQDFLDDGDFEGYAQEYLNIPIDPNLALFKKEHFLEMTDADYQSNKTYYCGVDFTSSDARHSDFGVFAVAGSDPAGFLHYMYVLRDRMESPETIECFFNIASAYPEVTFIVERGAIWNVLKPQLEAEMRRRETHLQIIESRITNQQDKVQKSAPLKIRMYSRSVKWNKESDWYAELEAEFIQFPKARHDDQVDACSIIPLNIDKLDTPQTDEEEEEEEYLRIRKQRNRRRAVSRITGY